MNDLSRRDLELVALGAAMGSNCTPCVEFHIPEARKSGLSDAEILAAIRHADKIRQVPARKTLQTALKMLPSEAGATGKVDASEERGPGAAPDGNTDGADKGTPMPGMMPGMMAEMMAACCGPDRSEEVPISAGKTMQPDAPVSEGCGCG